MADYLFDFSDDRIDKHSPGALAMRNACLWPLTGMVKTEEGHPDYSTAYTRLHQFWRARTVAYRVNNDPSIRNGTKYQSVRNCAPFGLKRTPRLFYCKRPRACPMCFARMTVRETFNVLRHYLSKWQQSCLTPYTLLAYQQVVEVNAEDPMTAVMDPELYRIVERYRKPRIELPDPVGGFRCVSLSPAAVGLTIDVGGIRAVPAWVTQDVVKQTRAADGVVLRVLAPKEGFRYDLYDLAKLVGWAIRFPHGMLWRDAGVAVAILNRTAASKAKQITTSGVFREASQSLEADREERKRLAARPDE